MGNNRKPLDEIREAYDVLFERYPPKKVTPDYNFYGKPKLFRRGKLCSISLEWDTGDEDGVFTVAVDDLWDRYEAFVTGNGGKYYKMFGDYEFCYHKDVDGYMGYKEPWRVTWHKWRRYRRERAKWKWQKCPAGEVLGHEPGKSDVLVGQFVYHPSSIKKKLKFYPASQGKGTCEFENRKLYRLLKWTKMTSCSISWQRSYDGGDTWVKGPSVHFGFHPWWHFILRTWRWKCRRRKERAATKNRLIEQIRTSAGSKDL